MATLLDVDLDEEPAKPGRSLEANGGSLEEPLLPLVRGTVLVSWLVRGRDGWRLGLAECVELPCARERMRSI